MMSERDQFGDQRCAHPKAPGAAAITSWSDSAHAVHAIRKEPNL
jgi:hypothetical protein